MKTIKYIVFILLFFSCSTYDDSTQETNEFLSSMLGRYKLKAIYTENEIDLDFDDLRQSDMFQEMNCFFPLEAYTGEIKINGLQGYTEMRINIPSSHIDSDSPPFGQTFNVFSLFYKIDVSSTNGNILITQRSEEFENQYGRLVGAEWIDNILYISLDKEFFTADGIVTERLYMEYEQYTFSPIE